MTDVDTQWVKSVMGHSILIVDDDEPLRELLSHHLGTRGYDTVVCTDGRDAVETLQAGFDPDLVVLDVMMPRLDGKRVLRLIRNDGVPVPSDLPVIMLTSRSREEDILEGFESGADDYVTKPFKAKELLVRVQKQLEKPEP